MGEFTSSILDSALPIGELEPINQLSTVVVIVAILIVFSIIKIIEIKKHEEEKIRIIEMTFWIRK